MTATLTSWIRRHAAGAALAAVLVAVMTGCATGAASPTLPASSSSGSPSAALAMPVELRIGDHSVAATLTDTPAWRQFAAMPPLSLQMRDMWGQAKSGPLPQLLTVKGSTAVDDPTPGTSTTGPEAE